MKHRLPDYLCASYYAKANEENMVVYEDIRITMITPRLIRMEQGAFVDDATQCVVCRDFGKVNYSVRKSEAALDICTDFLHIIIETGKEFSNETVQILSLTSPGFLWKYGQKPLVNLGGTTSTLDKVNGSCTLEDGVCSQDGYTFFSDSESARILGDGWFAKRDAGTDVYFFGYGHDYTACVQDYTRLTGGPGLLPSFALGNWWSRYWQYTEEEYISLMDRFQQEDVPISVSIVDMDWHLTAGENRTYHEGWTGYTWNRNLFPDYRRFLRGLADRNLKTALNLHPAQGIRNYEEQYEKFAEAMGVSREERKTIPFNCLSVDFLKTYFEVLLFPYERDGVDFWWIDWQQGNDYRRIVGDSFNEEGLSNITPLWMLNHMHYLASKRNGKRGMIFSRYAGYGSQRYPIGFSGDTVISWASLDFQAYFTSTAANIGYGWWSHDIGGHYGGIRDDELTARWIQLGVFSPIFRLHSTENPFLGREPWNYNRRVEMVIKDFMRLRHCLFPYLYTMNHISAERFLPLVRPMYHMNPEDKDAYTVKNEYWFGTELIVSPITSPADSCTGMGSAETWLPEGVFVDAMTGVVYKGNRTIRMFRPLEQIPAFLKAGGIIPLQAHHMHDNHLGKSNEITLLIAPGANGSFTLYEDDGETLNYLKGEFAETRFTYHENVDHATLIMHPSSGMLSLIPQVRNIKVMLRGVRKNVIMSVKGKQLTVIYDERTHTAEASIGNVSAEIGIEIQISCVDSILNDNSDLYDLCMDRIMRAQCTMEVKNAQWKWLQSKTQPSVPIRLNHEDTGYARMLYLSLCELLLQRNEQSYISGL